MYTKWVTYLLQGDLAVSNKKFELMLTRRAKAYSGSCSQNFSLSPAISSHFILGVCAAAEGRKNE